MALTISKSNSFLKDNVVDAITYNTDVRTLFDAFNMLETQQASLGGLTITPVANGTSTFKITKSDGTVLFSVDTTNGLIGIGMNVADYL